MVGRKPRRQGGQGSWSRSGDSMETEAHVCARGWHNAYYIISCGHVWVSGGSSSTWFDCVAIRWYWQPITGQASDSAHLANEKISLDNFKKGKVNLFYICDIVAYVLIRVQDVLYSFFKQFGGQSWSQLVEKSIPDWSSLSSRACWCISIHIIHYHNSLCLRVAGVVLRPSPVPGRGPVKVLSKASNALINQPVATVYNFQAHSLEGQGFAEAPSHPIQDLSRYSNQVSNLCLLDECWMFDCWIISIALELFLRFV